MPVIKINLSEAEENQLFGLCETFFERSAFCTEEDVLETVAEKFMLALWRNGLGRNKGFRITRVSIAPKLSPLIILDPPLRPDEKAYYVAVQVVENMGVNYGDKAHYVQAYIRLDCPRLVWSGRYYTRSPSPNSNDAFNETWQRAITVPKWNVTLSDDKNSTVIEPFTTAVLFEVLSKLDLENSHTGLEVPNGREVTLPRIVYDWLLDVFTLDPSRVLRNGSFPGPLVTVVKFNFGFVIKCRSILKFNVPVIKDSEVHAKYEKFLSVFLSKGTVVEFLEHVYARCYDLGEARPTDWLKCGTYSHQLPGYAELCEITNAIKATAKLEGAKAEKLRKQNYLKLRKQRF